jgi:hypothetical protein
MAGDTGNQSDVDWMAKIKSEEGRQGNALDPSHSIYTNRGSQMKLMMNQAEIERALVNEAGRMGIDLSNKETRVDLIAGRGPEGFKAEIEIVDVIETSEEAASADEAVAPDDNLEDKSVFG